MTKNNFLCPKCHGFLNANDNIVFSTKTTKGDQGLLLMHTELGNYKVTSHPAYNYQEGTPLDFFCPICHAELASDVNKNLAKILMVDEKGKEFDILFSKIAGEKSTYKVIGDSIEIYGDDSGKYIDFFNLSMMR